MKKINLVLLFIAIVFVSNAQKLIITDTDIKLRLGWGLNYRNGNFYSMDWAQIPKFGKEPSPIIVIHKLDKNLNKVEDVFDTVLYNGQSAFVGEPFETSRYIYAPVNCANAEKTESVLTIARLGDNNKFITFPFALAKQEMPKRTSGKIAGPNNDMQTIQLSPDKKIMASMYSAKYFKGQDNEQVQLKVFDEDLNTIWEKTQGFNDKSINMTLVNFKVNNDGIFAVLARITDTKTINFKLYIINKEKLEEHDISLNSDRIITGATMSVNDNGQFIISGIYALANLKKELKAKGVFAATYDNKMSQSFEIKTTPFSNEETDMINKSDGSLVVRKQYLFKDGLPVLFLEMNGEPELIGSYYSYGMNMYRYNEKIIIGFDSNLNVAFNKLIPVNYPSDVAFGPGSWFEKMDNNMLLLYRSNTPTLHAVFINDKGELSDLGVLFNNKGNVKTITKVDDSSLLVRISNPGNNVKDMLSPLEKFVWLNITP